MRVTLLSLMISLLVGATFVAYLVYTFREEIQRAIETLSETASEHNAGIFAVDFTASSTDVIGQLFHPIDSVPAKLTGSDQWVCDEGEQYRALFETTSDCIARVEIDDDAVIQSVNTRFEDRFGHMVQDIMGESLADFLAPAASTAAFENMCEQFRKEETVRRELRCETDDGTGEFLFRLIPIDSDGQETTPTEAYAVYTEITETSEREQAQQRLELNNQALRQIHEVTTDPSVDFEDAIHRLLKLGCEQFDLDVGILSEIEDGEYEVAEVVDSTGAITAGECFDIGMTPCEITVSGDPTDVLALSDIGASEYENHPAYQEGVAAAYIGTPVLVDGETYGTVNFSSRSARTDEFTESEREVVKLIAQWIGTEIERKEHERELEIAETVFENTKDALFVIDVDEDKGKFRYERSNPAHETHTGLSDGDVRGRELRDVFGEEARNKVIERYRLCRDRQEPVEYVEGENWSAPDGKTEIWETRLAPVVIDGAVEKIVGSSRNITDRKQRQEELERQRHLLEQSQRLANVGGFELDLRKEPPHHGMATDETKHIHEIPLDETFDMEDSLKFIHPEDRSRMRNEVERAIETGEPYDVEARLITAKGNERWVRTTSEPVYAEGDLIKLRGALQDITERKQHEQTLESLHDATRELLHTESEQEVCDVVVDIAEEIIGGFEMGLYHLNANTNEFVPAAHTPGFLDHCEESPTLSVGGDNSPVWNAFVSEEAITVDDPSTLEWIISGDGVSDAVQSGLFVPIGYHGVFTVLSTEAELDSRTRKLAETLVATTEAAFDRLESEASLREKEETLQEQNNRLKRQIQTTEIIRTVDQSLVDATTREEIQTAVCECLAESDLISFAWIGRPTDERVVPQTWAGDGHSYLDAVPISAKSDEPTWQTAETDSPTVVERVIDRLQTEPWPKDALKCGFHSVISIPIRHGGYTYGVLSAYVAEENEFGEVEQPVFVELGETIGNAINAIETKEALYTDSGIELKLRFEGQSSLLLKLADEAACRIEFEGLAVGPGDTTRLFFHADGAEPDEITRTLDNLVTVTAFREISRTDDGGHYEASVAEGLIAETLVTQGLSPCSILAENGSMDVIVDLPAGTDVREFVNLLQDQYESVELLTRRDVERSIGTKADLINSLFETLTDRQRETLTTAYYSGFFEWPRETTGQEIAAMLDVSQPTVTRHLRLGQRALLGQLFDGEYRQSIVPA